ncbi:MAG: HAD hydrolase-like protein [archaeon]
MTKPLLKGLICDLDGVLIDSNDRVFDWNKYVVEVLFGKEFKYKNDDKFKDIYNDAYASHGLKGAYALFGIDLEKNIDFLKKNYTMWNDKFEVPIFSDVVSVLMEIYHTLHDRNYDIRLAINSGNSLSKYLPQLERTGLMDIVAVSVTADDVEKSLIKPKPYTIAKTLKLLGVESNEALYICDTSTDVTASKRLLELGIEPVDMVLSTWGRFESPEAIKILAEEDIVVKVTNEPEELIPFVYERCGLF